MTPPNNQEQPLNLNKMLKIGLIALAAFMLTFGIWAFFSPIESAAVAQGKVAVDTNRKSIQHLRGGRIREILVKEGDFVTKGAPLVQLDDTEEKIDFAALQKEQFQLLATKARLEAILNQNSTIEFPESLLQNQNNPAAQEVMLREKMHFQNHNQFIEDQISILERHIHKQLSIIASAKKREEHETGQLDLVRQEEEEVKKLREENLVSLPRLLGLQREGKRLEGSTEALEGTIQEARKEILRANVEKQATLSKSLKDSSVELADLVKRLFEVEGKMDVLKDTLSHSLITSPIDGSIVNLRYHTIGGVVKPGDVIMDIVPINDRMIVEAQVNPLDIDVVHPGLKAKVDFLPYVKQRNVPIMNGSVTIVSADVFTDEKTGHSYYRVYIEIPSSELEKAANVKLYPGMPAQVMIINDKRTPFEYFLSPITKSFNRAFREK